MSVAVGSGYTLHYFDEAKGEHVSVKYVPDLRSQRRDWHDRGRQHRNRKRRSWR